MYQNWHAHAIQKILKQLRSSQNGLSSASAARRYAKNGPNVLPKKKPLSKIRLFLEQFNNSLMFILFITVAISFFLGHYSDSIFISIVIFINTFVGFYQESKANNSLRALQKMVRVKVRVMRDGRMKEIDSEQIVQGDVIFFSPGDKIPADCRIIKSKDLKANESSLTGEWLSVNKKIGKLDRETAVSDRYNTLFMGTSVEMGEARAVVVKTGVETEFGKIVELVKQTDEPRTPLQKKIAHLSRVIGIFIIGLIALIIAEGYFMGKDIAEIFIASLALAVSAIPEGLLPAITVVLVLAMRRILKQRGVVKKLSAAESLGSVTVVCSDKTGTLTEGNMKMSHMVTDMSELLPNKKFENANVSGNQQRSNKTAFTIISLTNDAYIENPEDELHEWKVRGYFTDKALLLAGVQAGFDIQKLEKECPLIEKQSFSSHKRYALSLRSKGSKKYLFVVGAPEELISRSSNIHADGSHIALEKSDKKHLHNKVDQMTSKGLRVIACAYRELKNGQNDKLDSLVHSLSFVGFVALRDPIRKDARRAILEIQEAGIRPIIITGDHKHTAMAVAREAGINVSKSQVLEGRDIERMNGAELKKHSKSVAIYARALPEHKLNVIKALHQNNEIVAMFGDGVNDAPALKAADIGVAVGSGTDVVKEVADVILLDDNFKTIVKAIEQGRVAFANIRKVFIYLVADDFTEIFLFLGAMALGLPLPLLAAQILWINLIEDGLPDIALTTEQETEDVMREKPRRSDEPILSTTVKKWMIAVFSINSLITFAFFWFLYQTTQDIVKTRTLVFALMAFDSLAFAYSVRSLKRTIFRRDIFSNKILNWAVAASFLLLLVAIYVPFAQKFVGTVGISLSGWLFVLGITFFEIIIIEVAKKISFKSAE
ncbi:MAG: cation-transporting P-type ATPase [Patescibacteria group bacterium]|nr:cation-transporting P-type ATPase [Patescibacteria group bacterium]